MFGRLSFFQSGQCTLYIKFYTRKHRFGKGKKEWVYKIRGYSVPIEFETLSRLKWTTSLKYAPFLQRGGGSKPENVPFSGEDQMLAERQGFEPWVAIRLLLLSKQVHSTTMRPLLFRYYCNVFLIKESSFLKASLL